MTAELHGMHTYLLNKTFEEKRMPPSRNDIQFVTPQGHAIGTCVDALFGFRSLQMRPLFGGPIKSVQMVKPLSQVLATEHVKTLVLIICHHGLGTKCFWNMLEVVSGSRIGVLHLCPLGSAQIERVDFVAQC